MDNHTTSLVPVDGTEPSTVLIPAEARNKRFSISNLPREVRDIIWGFIVVIPKVCVTGMRDHGNDPWPQPSDILRFRFGMVARSAGANRFSESSMPRWKGRPNLNIILVCRQFYWEAMRVYYLENSFLFCMDDDGSLISGVRQALEFLQDRPALALQYTRHIELDISDYTSAGGRFMSNCLVIIKSCSLFARPATLKLRYKRYTDMHRPLRFED